MLFKRIISNSMDSSQTQGVALYDSEDSRDRTLSTSPIPIQNVWKSFSLLLHPNICSLESLYGTWIKSKKPIHHLLLLMALNQILTIKDYDRMMFCLFIDRDGTFKVFALLNHYRQTIIEDILEMAIDTSRQADKNLNDASRVQAQLELLKKDRAFQKQIKLQLQDLLQGQGSGNEQNKPPIQVQADDNPTPQRSQTNIDDASRVRERQEWPNGDPENQKINQSHGDDNVIQHNLNFKGAFGSIIDDAQYQQQVHQGHPQSGQPVDQFQDHGRVNQPSLQIDTPKKNKLKLEPLSSYIMVLLRYIYQEYTYTENTKKRQSINLEQINCLNPLVDVNNILIQLFICCRVVIAVLFDVAFEHIKVDLDSETFNFIFVNAQSGKIYFINQTHLDYHFKRQTMYILNTRDVYTTQDALLDMNTFNMKLVDQGRDFEPWAVSLNCIKQTPLSYYNCLIQLSQWNPLEAACPQCGVRREKNSWILDTVFSVLHSHLFKNKQIYGLSLGSNIKLFFNNLKLYVQAIGEPVEFMTMETFDDVYDPYECVNWLKRGYFVKKMLIEDEEAYYNEQITFDHGQHLFSLMEQALLDDANEQQNCIEPTQQEIKEVQNKQFEALDEIQDEVEVENYVGNLEQAQEFEVLFHDLNKHVPNDQALVYKPQDALNEQNYNQGSLAPQAQQQQSPMQDKIQNISEVEIQNQVSNIDPSNHLQRVFIEKKQDAQPELALYVIKKK